jgi:hypothetical protein
MLRSEWWNKLKAYKAYKAFIRVYDTAEEKMSSCTTGKLNEQAHTMRIYYYTRQWIDDEFGRLREREIRNYR